MSNLKSRNHDYNLDGVDIHILQVLRDNGVNVEQEGMQNG